MKKIIFVLIDGIGDIHSPYTPSPTTDTTTERKTPLQSTHLPTLNKIAYSGYNGLMDPVSPGLACGSDTAHLSLFGMNPFEWYRGRGAFECLGTGLDMGVGDLAFKCNFATLNPKTKIITSRRASRQFSETGPLLCQYLSTNLPYLKHYPNHTIKYQYATEHRLSICISGVGLSDRISNSDPLKDGMRVLEVKPLLGEGEEGFEEAMFTAEMINALSREIHLLLQKHPINQTLLQTKNQEGELEGDQCLEGIANIILFRGAGIYPQYPAFSDQHPGFKAVGVAPTCMISGFLKSIGIRVFSSVGGTGDYHSDLREKAETMFRLMSTGTDSTGGSGSGGDRGSDSDREYNFGFLHVKMVDDAGHDHNYTMKEECLYKVDLMLERLIARLTSYTLSSSTDTTTAGTGNSNESSSTGDKDDYYLVLTGDHSTPVYYGDHSNEPVPFSICRLNDLILNRKGDRCEKYDEEEMGRGCLGRFTGGEVLGLIKGIMGMS